MQHISFQSTFIPYHYPCYFFELRNQPIIAHKSRLLIVTLTRSKCSKSHYFASICIIVRGKASNMDRL